MQAALHRWTVGEGGTEGPGKAPAHLVPCALIAAATLCPNPLAMNESIICMVARAGRGAPPPNPTALSIVEKGPIKVLHAIFT